MATLLPSADHAALGSVGPLRRQLSRLVVRDAVNAYWGGAVLVLLPLVYLWREWPPWAIRDALVQLPVTERAVVMAALHVVYARVTAPVVRRLLASERLRWWWTLPLSAGWWRALHVRHLVLLDAPWLLAIAYGVAPRFARGEPLEALACGGIFMALTLAGQVALVASGDRRGVVAVTWLGAYAGAVALAVAVPLVLGGAVAAVSLGLAVQRLGRPLPEVRARLRGLAGGHPVVALARLGWLAASRRDRMVVGWGIGLQLAAVALVALGHAHVGAVEVEAMDALRRGLAVVCAVVGTAVVLRAVRIVDGDRVWLDSVGIEPRHERRAWLLLAATGVLPAAAAGLVVLAWRDAAAHAWLMDLGLATGWAALGIVTLGFGLEAGRRLHEPRMPRLLVRMGLAVLLVVGFETVGALLPWAVLDAVRLRGLQRRAERARLRFETARRDDHQG